MTAMNPALVPAPWFRQPWPWLLASGPLAVVLAGGFTMALAFGGADGLVSEDYYKQGLAINRDLAREGAAKALALEGTVGAHQRFLLKSQIELIEVMEKQIEAINVEVEQRMRPFQAAIDLIDQIPGIARHGAEQIIAEIGVDMTRFPTPGHFASWARVCPGTNESAGKRRTASTGAGNPWLRAALVEAALASVRAGRAHPNFFAARYRRLASRRGPKRAQMAIAHSMLIAIYHMLRDGAHFVDLGPEHWDSRHRESVAQRSIRRLQQLGYKVTVEEVA